MILINYIKLNLKCFVYFINIGNKYSEFLIIKYNKIVLECKNNIIVIFL